MLGALVGSPPARRRLLAALGCAAGLLALAGCTVGVVVDASAGPLDRRTSVTDDATTLVDVVEWGHLPAYHVTAEIDPESGAVEGRLEALVPVAEDDDSTELTFVPLFRGAADDVHVTDVEVAGRPVDVETSAALGLVTVPVPEGVARRVAVGMDFGFTALEPVLPSFSDDDLLEIDEELLQDADLRLLLGRVPDGLLLTSWFPTVDRQLVGDSSARFVSPAGEVSLEVRVPAGTTVLTSGVRARSWTEPDGTQVVVDQLVGARHVGVVVLDEVVRATETVDDTDVTVVVGERQRSSLDGVLDDATAALGALEEHFGPYPWTELDLVSLTLPITAGGLATSGLVTVDQSYARASTAALLERRRWVVTHEIAHQWWAGTVHFVDADDAIHIEALAQFSTCLVYEDLWPDRAAGACRRNVDALYRTMRRDHPDAAIDHSEHLPSDQRSGLVYGKAPGFYAALVEEHGRDEVVAALAAIAEDSAFGLLADGELVDRLGDSLEDPSGVDGLRDRWLGGAHGDEDLDRSPRRR